MGCCNHQLVVHKLVFFLLFSECRMSLPIRKVRITNQGINFFPGRKILCYSWFCIMIFVLLTLLLLLLLQKKLLSFDLNMVASVFWLPVKRNCSLVESVNWQTFKLIVKLVWEVRGLASTFCGYFHKFCVHKPRIAFNVEVCSF